MASGKVGVLGKFAVFAETAGQSHSSSRPLIVSGSRQQVHRSERSERGPGFGRGACPRGVGAVDTVAAKETLASVCLIAPAHSTVLFVHGRSVTPLPRHR